MRWSSELNRTKSSVSKSYYKTGTQRKTEGVEEKEIYWDNFGVKFWYRVRDEDERNAPDGKPEEVQDDRWDNLLVSQVLEYGLNLDVAFLQHVEEYTGASYGLPIALVKWLIPLEWVVDSGNTQLVELFLGKGADANFSTFPRDGPALVKAVKKMDQKLIRMLLPTTNRVNSTRALCHAVELQDIGIATTLIRTAFSPTLKI
ncbi:hypothetical protein JX266_012207 [Neoarthrinium moseri]|nr:hypothetical protein JX266_012207 [Neoarthrinium moseri]